jgi:hypothetical protein
MFCITLRKQHNSEISEYEFQRKYLDKICGQLHSKRKIMVHVMSPVIIITVGNVKCKELDMQLWWRTQETCARLWWKDAVLNTQSTEK